MPIAFNLLRDTPHYRRQAFDEGLRAAGYTPIHHWRSAKPGDVLVIWNRYGEWDSYAAQFEKIGNAVLIAENGYYDAGQKHYAISKSQHHHGGAGLHRKFHPDMVGVKPGKHILVCAQRGIGSPLMASPPEWAEKTAEKLRALTKREVRIRYHPGKEDPANLLFDDLKDCHACVVWSSACGVAAMMVGVQVFYDAPRWIAEASATPLSCVFRGECDINAIQERPPEGLRHAFSNQYSVEEICLGIPFKLLLKG